AVLHRAVYRRALRRHRTRQRVRGIGRGDMERTAVPAVARVDALGAASGSVRGLRRGVEPLALAGIIARRWTEAAAWACALGAMLLFARLALARHDAFESHAYDYAFFDQIIWNTAHGRLFDTSFLSYNFLGQPFEPVLLLYALAYRAGAGIDSLALTQAWAAGAA